MKYKNKYMKWKNNERGIGQAGGLLLTRRSGTLRRAWGLIEFEADFAPFQPTKQKAVDGVKTYQFSHSKDWVAGKDKMEGAEYMNTSSDANQTHWIEDFMNQVKNLPEGNYRYENGQFIRY
jgi:hypothetical protein